MHAVYLVIGGGGHTEKPLYGFNYWVMHPVARVSINIYIYIYIYIYI
jgi:hypothetical protein